ncbi:MAG: PIG-L deacetylase family protein [Chthoniobacterales bacterium]
MIALAAAAHPDDIEFMMAGTLLRLKDAGCEIHLWNLANGCCGSATLSPEEAAAVRWEEARASAKLAGGMAQPPLFDDLGIYYDAPSVARAAAVIRQIQPDIILTHSPQDYMEDHQNTTRLVVTGAFTRAMKNFVTNPVVPAYDKPVALYHALPHGLNDALRQPVAPHFFTDIGPVLARKRAMLACHASQKEWLDVTQGMNAYLDEMERMSAAVGRMSGRFAFAEGWRRHSHLGFAAEDYDPVSRMLKI